MLKCIENIEIFMSGAIFYFVCFIMLKYGFIVSFSLSVKLLQEFKRKKCLHKKICSGATNLGLYGFKWWPAKVCKSHFMCEVNSFVIRFCSKNTPLSMKVQYQLR